MHRPRKHLMEARLDPAGQMVQLVCTKFYLTPFEARALGLALIEKADEIDPDGDDLGPTD